ncbi:MAG: MerR family DNA-binding transcriptional regulator, partial [Pseudomonadota bacterium]|nr:MerR family DNA-binding transcriptional regulator [Pseudomonadota bacterium]
MKKLVSISVAAKALGVTPLTLRRWDESGRLKPDSVTAGG